jgi:protocatechuate 3,4-dioxygenase beta subunit
VGIVRLLFTIMFLFVIVAITSARLAIVEGAGGQMGRGTITGRVVTESGQPLPNAIIIANGAGVMSRAIQQIVTDEEGKFQIADLSPGAYTVLVRAFGYIDPLNSFQESNEKIYYRPGDSMTITMVKGGVITGTVTNSVGDPVVGAQVKAVRVRDKNGRPVHSSESQGRTTDDRGIYRIFGLQPGSYLITAGGNHQFYFSPSPYDGDAATYYPSTTRSTAKEVKVSAGEEVTGIDIRYRGERGSTISGTISGSLGSSSPFNSFNVMLANASDGTIEANVFIRGDASEKVFSFFGIADGEYDLAVSRGLITDDGAVSIPRRVVIKGADVTGIELTLLSLASIKGKVILDTRQTGEKIDCASGRADLLEKTVLQARRDEKADPKDRLLSQLLITTDAVPNDNGEFTLQNLDAGRYHLEAKFPGEDHYIRSIVLTAKMPSKEPNELANNGLSLKLGDRLTGLTITIGEGAAGVRGRVVTAKEGKQLPARLRVHLIPSEKEHADNTIRFSETEVRNGEFKFANIAPGRYWLLARTQEEIDRPLAWDNKGRAMLRREAMTANTVIDLPPCKRIADYLIQYKK